MMEWNIDNLIHEDKIKLSVYLSACIQADFSSRNQIRQTVNTNLFEQGTCDLNGVISGLP